MKTNKTLVIIGCIVLALAIGAGCFAIGRFTGRVAQNKANAELAAASLFEDAKDKNFSSTPVCSTIDDFKYTTTRDGIVITGFLKENNITIVDIPAEINEVPVIAIASSAFENNIRIETVSVGVNVAEIGARAFANCARLKMVVCGYSLACINKEAFDGCASLSVMSLNQGLNMIMPSAFQGTSIRRLIVPKSVTLFDKPFGNTTAAVTLYGDKGSYIENYCEINNINFKVYDQSEESTEVNNPLPSQKTETPTKKSKIKIDDDAVVDDGKFDLYTGTTKPASTTKTEATKAPETTAAQTTARSSGVREFHFDEGTTVEPTVGE